mmetsp:Transcript_3723/g.13759  ORF Transcript_3723/g.13759 Transcript_3723/m.13759 type:complete len:210 (+) Transcript_3723:527-1156(+)
MKVMRSRSYLCTYLHNFAEAALQQDLLRIYLLPEGPKPTPFLDDPELVAVRRARTTSNVPDTVQEGLHQVRVRQARGQLALEGHALGELLVEVLDDLHGHRRNVPPRAVHPTEGATTDYDNQIDVLEGRRRRRQVAQALHALGADLRSRSSRCGLRSRVRGGPPWQAHGRGHQSRSRRLLARIRRQVTRDGSVQHGQRHLRWPWLQTHP